MTTCQLFRRKQTRNNTKVRLKLLTTQSMLTRVEPRHSFSYIRNHSFLIITKVLSFNTSARIINYIILTIEFVLLQTFVKNADYAR